MTDSRFFRLLGISLVAALWLSLSPQAAAQVTVNAPQGLLGGKDKKETKAKPDKDSKDKSQQGKDKNSDPGIVAPGEGETQLGDGQAQSPAEPRHDTHAVKPAGRGKVKITGAMKESFHYYDQAITKQVTGYRIQVLFSSRRGARNLAYARAKELAMAFPQYHYYVSYNAPQWRLRVGDFTRRESARRALRRIKKAFRKYASETIIVTDTVNVWGDAAAPVSF